MEIEVSRGSGPGGQHKNKTETLVKAIHTPTGITAKADGRSQHSNKIRALQVLAARVEEDARLKAQASHNGQRQSQMGGQRSFTWTDWRDQVVNHRTGRKAKMSKVLRGDLNLLE